MKQHFFKIEDEKQKGHYGWVGWHQPFKGYYGDVHPAERADEFEFLTIKRQEGYKSLGSLLTAMSEKAKENGISKLVVPSNIVEAVQKDRQRDMEWDNFLKDRGISSDNRCVFFRLGRSQNINVSFDQDHPSIPDKYCRVIYGFDGNNNTFYGQVYEYERENPLLMFGPKVWLGKEPYQYQDKEAFIQAFESQALKNGYPISMTPEIRKEFDSKLTFLQSVRASGYPRFDSPREAAQYLTTKMNSNDFDR